MRAAQPISMTSQLTLFSKERLAYRPYCADEKDVGLRIRGTDQALQHKYIQVNCPAVQFRIIIDIDRDIRSTAELHRWSDDYNAPQPNWTAISPRTGHAHLSYEIEVPVARHDQARAAPLRLAAAIEDGLITKLGADLGYVGLICKNPHHPAWRTVVGRVLPYDLTELSDWVDLKKYKGKDAKVPEGALGRNCAMFDRLRLWAYGSVRDYKGRVPLEVWQAAVEAKATEFNHFHGSGFKDSDPLARSEIRATARSVAKWVWKNFGDGKAHLDFIATQRHRSGLAAAAKRAKTEDAIRQAQAELISECELPTLRAVAKRIGKHHSGLVKHYAHLFEQIAH